MMIAASYACKDTICCISIDTFYIDLAHTQIQISYVYEYTRHDKFKLSFSNQLHDKC